MGPLDIFLGWQPLMIAFIAYAVVQLVKAILDASMGQQKRKDHVVLTRIVLPALAPVVGALAAFIPAHPQSLVDYVAANGLDWWVAQLVFAAWGAACGQFSDYLYSKIKSFMKDAR